MASDFGPVGVRFSETASGYVANQISDLSVAESTAKTDGTWFRLALQISIPRLQDFLDSSAHIAQIESGAVSWKPNLTNVPVLPGGKVTFFRDSESTASQKFIDYDFSFAGSAGHVIGARGIKNLHNDNGLDAVTDLTTIQLTVQPDDGSTGTGTVKANIVDLLRQIKSCQITGAQSKSEEEAARQAFLGFMNGQLRQVYPNLPLLFQDTAQLTPEQRRTLTLLARLLLPKDLPAAGPRFDDIMSALDRFLANASSTMLSTIAGWLQAIGIFLPPDQTDLTLLRMLVTLQLNNTDRSPVRDVLQLLHTLIVFPYYSHPKADHLVGYTRPAHKPRNTPDLPVVSEPPDRVFDFVIAGSGPAGTLLAQRLSATAKSVLLLESGPYVPERTIDSDEVLWTARLYKASGLQQANAAAPLAGMEGPGFTVLQGSCVGGGGIINNAVCFRLPAQRLTEWQNSGFPIATGDLASAYTRVAQDLGIKPVSEAMGSDPRLNPAWKFLTASLGPPKKQPLEDPPEPGLYECLVNIEDCQSTGLCNVGCGSERKRNGVQVYLRQAAAAGCVIVDHAEVQSVRLDNSSPQGSRRVQSLDVRLRGGKQVTVKGNEFILSCGPIGSSVVLLRSKDLESHIGGNGIPVGRRFSANLGSPIFAFCREQVNQRPGLQIAHYYFAPPDNGFVIETWFNPPGANSIGMPGFQQAHFERMMAYSRTVAASPLVGTEPSGRISLDLLKAPMIELPVSSSEIGKLRRGLGVLAQAFLAGNVESALVGFGNGRKLQTAKDLAQFDRDMQQIEKDPAKAYLLKLGSGHPQGGNAMSEDPRIGVVDREFRLRGFSNLRICDGSIFPASAGVNPQWTIMALAHECARLLTGGV